MKLFLLEERVLLETREKNLLQAKENLKSFYKKVTCVSEEWGNCTRTKYLLLIIHITEQAGSAQEIFQRVGERAIEAYTTGKKTKKKRKKFLENYWDEHVHADSGENGRREGSGGKDVTG